MTEVKHCIGCGVLGKYSNDLCDKCHRADEKIHQEDETSVDMVNSPPHYQSEDGLECIDAIVAALGLEGAVAYCRGNVIKYSWRIKNPNEDMGKASWYANKADELLKRINKNKLYVPDAE